MLKLNQIIIIIVLSLVQCKKADTGFLHGKWFINNITVSNYYSNDYTGQSNSIQVNFSDEIINSKYLEYNFFDQDTLKYYEFKGIYELSIEINTNDVTIMSKLFTEDYVLIRDTIYYTIIEKGNFDFEPVGGRKYNYKINFYENNFYLIGGDGLNSLCFNEDDFNENSLKLSYYSKDFQPTTASSSCEYTFIND
ncbi:MAG: hypothetical protein DRI95_05060 [Bacteroidetes bacterium]|nr:MAG: hypothetical protein DRI95_05060 [Bacteroidota bacterium]